jgi:hypothetical protein
LAAKFARGVSGRHGASKARRKEAAVSVLAAIAGYSMLAFAAVLFLLQWTAREIGYFIGKRTARSDGVSDGVGVVTTSMLGLLAFVLGLTLAFANTRYQERRQDTLEEAQSIGTSWLRAAAVEQPESTQIAHLLEDYARLRLEFVTLGNDPADFERVNRGTDALQSQIWALAISSARKRPDPVNVALMVSLNETFDLATAQRLSLTSGPAPALVALLIGLAMATMGVLGFQFGVQGRPMRVLTALLLGTWTAVLVVIIDLGAARLGSIRTDPGPIVWTIESFSSGPQAASPR